ncbi:MAG TPA: hypothetical protein VJJ80_02425 [Patescibacteria group bacterium]|nr:hypothetical protein [Patescibacteria group bacterium]
MTSKEFRQMIFNPNITDVDLEERFYGVEVESEEDAQQLLELLREHRQVTIDIIYAKNLPLPRSAYERGY